MCVSRAISQEEVFSTEVKIGPTYLKQSSSYRADV